jgi:hypothetical protein
MLPFGINELPHFQGGRSAGHEHGDPPAQGIHPQRPLAPCEFFPAVIPALGASDLGGLDRWAIDACGAGGGLASRFYAVPFSPCLDQPGPGPIGTPLGEVGIDRTLREEIGRQPVPLATPPVQGAQGIADFPPIHLTRATSTGGRLGRGNQWAHNGPWLVRQIRGIFLSRQTFLYPRCALLYGGDMR